MSQTASLELLVTFQCTADGSSKTGTLVLSPPPNRIEEIKSHIQEKESIPKCLQKLTFKNQLLSDSQSLSNLYIRSEDSLTCSYLARADVKQLGKFIHGSLHPVLTRLQADASSLSQFHPKQDMEALLHHCELQFHNVAYSRLLPWASVTAEANRQFLIQEGGIDHTMQLYALLLQVPWADRHLLLQRLELSCLSLLWNFAETASARQLVVERGGFPMMVQSLMHYSHDEFLQKYRMYDIFDTAIGCVSKYVPLHSYSLIRKVNLLFPYSHYCCILVFQQELSLKFVWAGGHYQYTIIRQPQKAWLLDLRSQEVKSGISTPVF